MAVSGRLTRKRDNFVVVSTDDAIDVIEQLALYDANAARRSAEQLRHLMLSRPSEARLGAAVLALGLSAANKRYASAIKSISRELTKMGVL